MNHESTNRPAPAARVLAAAAFAVAALALLLLPAAGQAHGKAKFGTDLSMPSMIDAVDAPQPCPLPGACTHVQSYYSAPPHAGLQPNSPYTGTITKVRLLADNPGKLTLQLVERGMGTDSKVTREGPKIRYRGTGSVETFKVHVPVEAGEWLAFKTKSANTLSCEMGSSGEEYVYTPALAPNGLFTAAHTTNECTALLGATVKQG